MGNESNQFQILRQMRLLNRQSEGMQIKYLKPSKRIHGLKLKIIRRYPPKYVTSEFYNGQIAVACGIDETGIVGVVLWPVDVETIQFGDFIKYVSEWCRLKPARLIVSIGRTGRLIKMNGRVLEQQ